MNKIYYYAKGDTPKITVADHEFSMTRHNQKWFVSTLESNSFSVSLLGQSESYSLPRSGTFAIYNKTLIELEPTASKVLLITDIDNTIFNDSTEGKLIYSQFITFWIKHFEFNGSKLVYNTGRSLERYNENKSDFYEPDLFLSVLGNYAYIFDETGEVVLLDALNLFVKNFADHDWNSEIFIDALVEAFPFMKDCLESVDPFNVYFKVPKHLVDDYKDRISEFSKNREEKSYNGCRFKGKTIITAQGMTDHRYVEMMPEFGGKGFAANFAKWYYSFIDENIVLAGDSLNDKDALKLGLKGVIVGNAEEGLMEWFHRKERKHLFVSSEKYALSVVDYLRRFHFTKTQSTVFLYREEREINIEVGGRPKALKRFKGNWLYFLTESSSFIVSRGGESLEFFIQIPDDFAVYEGRLLKINRNLTQVLLVTDLDGTAYNETQLGREHYRSFIRSWISNFEFNGSRLAYNSGRNVSDLLGDKDILFRPDLVTLCIGSFAFVYDENLQLVHDQGFELVQNETEKHDWNSSEILEMVCDKFGIDKKHLRRSYDNYLQLQVKNHVLGNLKDFKSFLKNKEKNEYKGKVYRARVNLVNAGMEDESFVEIVPLYIGKRLGLMFASKKFGFRDVGTFVSGDSPNDIDSLKHAKNKIVMKNSEAALFEWVHKKPRTGIIVPPEPWGLGLKIEIEKLIS